ncbi:hypothetical protein QIA31_05240 (plasmid) [Borreliella turdi]|uniref:hypothetical protein n=1 Tax=Borreliella turdi TaxID=57863 RepID=UPI003AEFAEF0
MPDWLFVYNPLVKELLLVHLIIEKTKLKNLIDDEASGAILDKIPDVIIDSGEDIETIFKPCCMNLDMHILSQKQVNYKLYQFGKAR